MFVNEMQEAEELMTLLNGISVDKRLLMDINRRLDKSGIYYRSFARVKAPDSLAAKLKSKNEIYEKEKRKLQDIVGVRIVLYFEDDVTICRKIIEEMFEVHKADSQIDELGVFEFRPERMNLVCTLPENYVRFFQERLWQAYRIDQTFELQIRTIFSEGWHEVEHDIRYKHTDEWKGKDYYGFNRELNGIKATLEICDHSILHNIEQLTYYCYENDKTEEMLRYKFRIHFENEHLSEKLKTLLTPELRKELYRTERDEVLMCLSDRLLPDLPKTLDNLVYVCNGLQIHNKGIEQMAPRIVKDHVKKYQDSKRI